MERWITQKDKYRKSYVSYDIVSYCNTKRAQRFLEDFGREMGEGNKWNTERFSVEVPQILNLSPSPHHAKDSIEYMKICTEKNVRKETVFVSSRK